MWGVLVLLFGMLFHTRSGQRKGKAPDNRHRQFYGNGSMREELDALNEGLEMGQRHDRRKK
jgi:hypothetical protein